LAYCLVCACFLLHDFLHDDGAEVDADLVCGVLLHVVGDEVGQVHQQLTPLVTQIPQLLTIAHCGGVCDGPDDFPEVRPPPGLPGDLIRVQ